MGSGAILSDRDNKSSERLEKTPSMPGRCFFVYINPVL